MICKYCNTDIGNKLMSGHLGKCKSFQLLQDDKFNSITKDFLYTEYVLKGKSAKHIAKELGFHPRKIDLKLLEFGIIKRTLQEAKKQNHHVELAKQTSNRKYGCDFHIAKNVEIMKKSKDTLMEKYGVNNIFQTDEVKEKSAQTLLKNYGVNSATKSVIIRNRVKQTCINRYGVDCVGKVPEFIKKMQETKFKNGKIQSHSSPLSQKFCWEIYERLPLELKEHCYFAELNKEFGKMSKSGKYYFYDFAISHQKKCIEFNGNYYHMNPELYKIDEFNKRRNLTSKEIYNLDEIKNDFIISLGFDILVIWEKDYKSDIEKTLQKCLKFIIGENYEDC